MFDFNFSNDGSTFYEGAPSFFIDDAEESADQFCHEIELKAAMLGITVDYYLMEFQ